MVWIRGSRLEVSESEDLALETLFNCGADPVGGALEGECAVLELLIKLDALVVGSVCLDDVRDVAEAGVGGVDANVVDAFEEERERLADDRGVELFKKIGTIRNKPEYIITYDMSIYQGNLVQWEASSHIS